MISCIVTTYMPDGALGNERAACLQLTIDSMMRQLVCDEQLNLVLADDGSPESRLATIQKVMRECDSYWESTSQYTNSHRRGIGGSLNAALTRVASDDVWMYNTDDWRLTDKLDLAGPTKLLRNGYDLVRLGPVHPDLRCMTRFDATIGWWLDLDCQYGGFAFATRPFVATRKFYDKIGPFDEMQNSYETERLYAERVAKTTSKLAYWGAVDLAGPFQHLGTESIGMMDL